MINLTVKPKLLLSVMSMVLFCHSQSIAGEPRAQLEQSINKVLGILKDPELKSDDKKAERRRLVSEVFAERFDYSEISKRALGKEWRRLDDEKRIEFTRIFRKLLERNKDLDESYG